MFISKRLNAVNTATMHKLSTSRENRTIATMEKTAFRIYNPLRDYEKELQETYKAVLQEIGIDYNVYMARKAGN